MAPAGQVLEVAVEEQTDRGGGAAELALGGFGLQLVLEVGDRLGWATGLGAAAGVDDPRDLAGVVGDRVAAYVDPDLPHAGLAFTDGTHAEKG